MSCKYNWYNLPNIIKKQIAQPLKSIVTTATYKTIQSITWFNSVEKLNDIFSVLTSEYLICASGNYPILKSNFIWYDLTTKIEILCDLRDAIILCNEATPLTAFNISTLQTDYCLGIAIIDNVAYHNGGGQFPSVGDLVYLDVNGTTFYPPNTGSNDPYYFGYTTDNGNIIIGLDGVVGAFFECR